uniref:uncharacterized protein LOC122593133 n=1 Tax=Erigeron canadensis TaxID=72917 RepID=UPI001CB93528|nr:uncharacterized protein LOC122593133 [Erigeron canadensis]
MNNYLVLFLVVVLTSTDLLSCTHSNKNVDQEIVMVIDDDNPSTQQMEQIIKAVDNRTNQVLQAGRFKLEDGKLLKLLRTTDGRENCYDEDQPCGAFHWCCGGLTCDGIVDGRCRRDPDDHCIEIDQPCGVRDPCCGHLRCDGFINGICRGPDYCIPVDSSCNSFHGIKCCDDALCDATNILPGNCRSKFYCLPPLSACPHPIFPSAWSCCFGSTCLYNQLTKDLRCM